MVHANASHLWCIHYNGLLGKHKYERQKSILEVPTQLIGIRSKNMKCGQSDYLQEYITFIYGK